MLVAARERWALSDTPGVDLARRHDGSSLVGNEATYCRELTISHAVLFLLWTARVTSVSGEPSLRAMAVRIMCLPAPSAASDPGMAGTYAAAGASASVK